MKKKDWEYKRDELVELAIINGCHCILGEWDIGNMREEVTYRDAQTFKNYDRLPKNVSVIKITLTHFPLPYDESCNLIWKTLRK